MSTAPAQPPLAHPLASSHRLVCRPAGSCCQLRRSVSCARLVLVAHVGSLELRSPRADRLARLRDDSLGTPRLTLLTGSFWGFVCLIFRRADDEHNLARHSSLVDVASRSCSAGADAVSIITVARSRQDR
jgi:hypothetical protein